MCDFLRAANALYIFPDGFFANAELPRYLDDVMRLLYLRLNLEDEREYFVPYFFSKLVRVVAFVCECGEVEVDDVGG